MSAEQLDQLLKQAEELSAEEKLLLAKRLIEQAHNDQALSISNDEFSDEKFSLLEKAAEIGDEVSFLQQLNNIDSNQLQAINYVQLIKLALKAGAPYAARRLSCEAKEHYPNDETLQRYARILSLPKIIRHYGPPDLSIKANRDWLKNNSKPYTGQWVALRNGQLLKVANSLAELVSQIPDRKGMLITQV